MAKRIANRRELREQAEAAEKRGAPAGEEPAADKKKAKEPKKKSAPRSKRSKVKVVLRKRLLWAVYSGSMKEEGRFPYAEREKAEARAAELTEKHKKTFFVQPVKEVLQEREVAESVSG